MTIMVFFSEDGRHLVRVSGASQEEINASADLIMTEVKALIAEYEERQTDRELNRAGTSRN